MQQTHDIPIKQDLVLIGGGHSHVIALKMLAMHPLPGIRITLISSAYLTPYSGMLPGLIAGHYSYDEVHIDLARLCRALGVRFIEDAVESLDLDNQQIHCANHPDFRYDLLSIDIGSSPDISFIPGAKKYTQPVKPVEAFLRYLDALQKSVLDAKQSDQALNIALVGAGASGVEVALAMQHAFKQKLKAAKKHAEINFHIVSATSDILPSHNPKVRARYRKVLAKRDVTVHSGFRVSRVEQGCLFDESGAENVRQLKVDEIIWAISASAPAWPQSAGLGCSDKGFIQVNECLQSVSHAKVFATGDIADVIDHPRPKAGVFAVRQGKPLAENLVRALKGSPLKAFKPQTQFLSLVSTGDKYAVASRGNWALSGKWVWRWKDVIDQKFMRSLNDLGKYELSTVSSTQTQDMNLSMRCGGCGAKVGQPILQRVISQLPSVHASHLKVSLSSPDDAAVFSVPENKLLVQSVDAFRRFIDDDFLFGQIAANHALGDIFAMGAAPHSAQAMVTLPFASEEKVEQQLLHLMLGATKVFDAANMPIIGGHTAEGGELSLGFAVNGLADEAKLLTKGGLQAGDVLILTKALGTGALFAADMRGQAKGVWIKSAIETMLVSNQKASEVLFSHGVKACTDVTGFGLAGHLLEMLQASRCRAKLDLDNLPVLDGALELMAKGFFSSLHEQNKQIEQKMMAYIEVVGIKEIKGVRPLGSDPFNFFNFSDILFDPQTAGGLLAGIPASKAEACLQELKALGYHDACIIGELV